MQKVECYKCKGKGYITDHAKMALATITSFGLIPMLDGAINDHKDSIFTDPCVVCSSKGYLNIGYIRHG